MGRVTNTCVNAFTGQTSKRVHHCTECGGPSSSLCLKRVHQSYCEECGRLFNVITRGGCTNHHYRDGYNKSVLQTRMAKDPGFNVPEGDVVEEPSNAVQEEEEPKPHDTDWSKPAYKPKQEPKAKQKETQGKKLRPAKTIADVILDRKTQRRGV